MKLDEKWLREHLPGFERYLMNVRYAFPEEFFRKQVERYTGLMNLIGLMMRRNSVSSR